VLVDQRLRGAEDVGVGDHPNCTLRRRSLVLSGQPEEGGHP
jgi:hypothetical protein